MASDITIHWDASELLGNLRELDKTLTSQQYGGLQMLMATAASQMEAWAKQNAPWTDRTGAARQRLHGEAYWEDSRVVVAAIMHQVDYGIWLELAHQRKYAILEKTINEHRDEVEKAVVTLLKRYMA